ncbi:MAG: hypothetical protein ACPG32_15220, partial [Akkermansiaceae bacterium]
NARLALMEAIAKLQISAGNDQTITATANFAGLADGTQLSAGAPPQNNISHDGQNKGLSSVANGTRHWTGTWRNRSANPASTIFTATSSAERTHWLVSGENPNPLDARVALNASGQVSDDSEAVVLVGKNTVGPASSTTIQNYVTAPLVKISNSTATTGGYAWWIGDEGVKARNNLRADYAANATARQEDLIANRRGWDAIAGFQNYPKPGQDQKLDKAISDREIELVEATLRGIPLQSTFHSATPYSIGLITNSLTGGLKTDLTYYLENGFGSSASFPNAPIGNQNIIPKSIAPNIRGPKWQQLKEFYDIGKNAGASSGELIVQSAEASGNTITIAPVITDLRALFGAKITKYSGTVYQFFPATKIAVSIANPYPYPLR